MSSRCGGRRGSGRPSRVAAGLAGPRNCTGRPDSRGPGVVEDEGDDGQQRDGRCRELDCCGTPDDRWIKK